MTDAKDSEQASGAKSGEAKASTDKSKVASVTPENKAGEINPSAPGETGTTPGSNDR